MSFYIRREFFAWDSFLILYDCFLEMRHNMLKKLTALHLLISVISRHKISRKEQTHFNFYNTEIKDKFMHQNNLKYALKHHSKLENINNIKTVNLRK